MAQTGYTVSGLVDTQTLSTLLQGFIGKRAGFGLVQRLDRIAWVAYSQGTAKLYFAGAAEAEAADGQGLATSWEKGRLFNADVEWRWQKLSGERCKLLGLSEDQAALAAYQAAPSQVSWRVCEPQKGQANLLLSGSAGGQGKPWIESRFPNKLVYPLWNRKTDQGKPRPPKLVYLEYQDEASGSVQFLRLMGLE
ncbi:MAG: hypothetical protein EXR62_09450 [Chloroflexi bacterium]|nr:hypothetical protein [Chloroflexota bacterium]